MLLENLFSVFARTLLGVFLGIVLALAAFLGGLDSVLFLSALEGTNYQVMAVLTTGIGAGIGGFIGWFSRSQPLSRNLLLLAMVGVTGVIGAFAGEQVGLTVWGAVLGANAPLVTLGVVKAMRDS